ncbi:MAG: glycosyltransferase, partial [Deltaproteobacteria bacterium]|nr:glycosyltransferase [Deltaproteobacteria bacterium]
MDNSPMKSSPARLLLIFNPKGVVDKDIRLSSSNGDIRVEAFEIELSKSPEGHTLERIDLLEIGKTILSFDPDFLLTINGGGLDNEGFLSYFCAYLGLPLVLWYVDEPFIIPEWGTKFNPRTTIAFTFDRFYERRLKEWGIPWVHTLPLGANHERLLGYGTRFPRETAFRNDVDMALEQYMLNFKQDTDKVVRDCAAALGVDFEYPDGITRQMVLSFIDREASFRLRHKTILSLQPFGIAVYGEPFWKKIVGERSYGGRVDYYSSEIADLYRKSRINLNISKYQLKTTVNQRAFDCPLCGGFLITDFREDVEEFFDIDKDMVVYRDLEELKKRVAFYLE